MPRTELGLVSTECACVECTKQCHTQPGFLLEADIDRIWKKIGGNMSRSEFIAVCLRPGKGAVVLDAKGPNDAQFIQYQTIQPAKRANGNCAFLRDEKCMIHDVAPFGCAFFDSHMSEAEGNERIDVAVDSLVKSLRSDGLYSMALMKLFGVKRFNLIKNVTNDLFPNGVPESYKELARYLHAERLKMGKAAFHDPKKTTERTGL